MEAVATATLKEVKIPSLSKQEKKEKENTTTQKKERRTKNEE